MVCVKTQHIKAKYLVDSFVRYMKTPLGHLLTPYSVAFANEEGSKIAQSLFIWLK